MQLKKETKYRFVNTVQLLFCNNHGRNNYL